MGLFDKVKRGIGIQDDSLREAGIKGTGKCVASKATHLSVGGDDEPGSGTPIHKVTLMVTVPDREPYDVECKVQGGLNVGGEYPVYVDPDDPNRIFVDVDAQTARFVSDALGSVSGAPVGTAGPMQPGMAGVQPGDWKATMAEQVKASLAMISDPAQRKTVIEQYRASGLAIDDDGNIT